MIKKAVKEEENEEKKLNMQKNTKAICKRRGCRK